MDSIVETCRRFYNDCLAERKTAYETERRSVTKNAQLRRVKALKSTNPYAKGVHSHILQVAVTDLDKAYQAFFRRVKAGETPGYPRFKGKNRFKSFGLKELGNGFRVDGRCLKLSGVGRVKVRWHRPLEGTVCSLRVGERAGKWYACFACELPEPATVLADPDSIVGVDVGLTSLMTDSEGNKVDNPRWYRVGQAELRTLQRTVARRAKGSNGRAGAVRELQRHSEHVANQRKDFLNKLAKDLVSRYATVVVEDLKVDNMARNPALSKSIMDAGWGYFRMRLVAKAEEAGRQVLAVDPAYTSKSCSGCGEIKDMRLSDRWFRCECGVSLDRDHNAAINILGRGRLLRTQTWDKGPSVVREAAGL